MRWLAWEQCLTCRPNNCGDIRQIRAPTSYAAGTVIYEMATGRRPFRANLPTELIADILNEAPASSRQLNPQISLGLEKVILRCVEKDPGETATSLPGGRKHRSGTTL